jgi:hypothetical protein
LSRRRHERFQRQQSNFCRELSRHHRIPRSRRGGEESIQLIPRDFHIAFHFCFKNMLLSEIHEFLDVLYSREIWTGSQIETLQNQIMNRSRKRLAIQEHNKKIANRYYRETSHSQNRGLPQ